MMLRAIFLILFNPFHFCNKIANTKVWLEWPDFLVTCYLGCENLQVNWKLYPKCSLLIKVLEESILFILQYRSCILG